ncbi:hypothetical protein CTI12_AA553370 [Artemisia annua]|uniref:Uncharacterized protein n=1 Tax=Artemisia annua TaxID=35608 RepID=A0A2U1KXP0_ARTAN|nr:hypothetical protein CTI12_AA553370 [Artemisia annua]
MLAEDATIFQRVATIMFEQMSAKVLVVGERVQAVEALNTYNWPAHSSYHMTSPYQPKLKLGSKVRSNKITGFNVTNYAKMRDNIPTKNNTLGFRVSVKPSQTKVAPPLMAHETSNSPDTSLVVKVPSPTLKQLKLET